MNKSKIEEIKALVKKLEDELPHGPCVCSQYGPECPVFQVLLDDTLEDCKKLEKIKNITLECQE